MPIVLIASALIGIAANVFFRQTSYQTARQASLNQKNDFKNLQNYVELNFSCPDTTSAPGFSCPSSGSIVLRDVNGTDILELLRPKIEAKYRLQATCQACPACADGKGIFVKVLPIRRHSFTGKDQEWRDLYGNNPLACEV